VRVVRLRGGEAAGPRARRADAAGRATHSQHAGGDASVVLVLLLAAIPWLCGSAVRRRRACRERRVGARRRRRRPHGDRLQTVSRSALDQGWSVTAIQSERPFGVIWPSWPGYTVSIYQQSPLGGSVPWKTRVQLAARCDRTSGC
jgi:hypothetical protein